MKVIKNVTLGADPELFLRRGQTIVSAVGLIGGTKQDPIPITNQGHAIQEDNILVEFNIPPSETQEDFINNLNIGLEWIEAKVKLLGLDIAIISSAEVDKDQLQTEQAKEFGCEPDFNLYLEDINDCPNPNTNLRTAGGHIHIGFDKPDEATSENLVFAMDVCLGLESILLDNDNRRRAMYGKAGSFRFKEYGIEYRTLSNFWIKTDNLKAWAFKKTLEAIELVNSGLVQALFNEVKDDVQKAIDTYDVDLVAKVSEKIEKIKEETLIKQKK